jgi:hypothetical protein
MKKTVIKRRKRVPAVGLTPALAARQASVNDTASPSSQSAQLDEKPSSSGTGAAGTAGSSSRPGSSTNLASLAKTPNTAEREKERERHPANGLNSVGTNNLHGRPPLLPSGSSGNSHASSPASRSAATSVPSHLQNAAALGALGAMRGTSPARRLEISLGPRDKLSTPAGLTSGSGPAASSRSAPDSAGTATRPPSATGVSGGGGGLYADALGLRNRTSAMTSSAGANNAVPLNRAGNGAAGAASSERKKPWWIEPGEEDRRKAAAGPKDTVCLGICVIMGRADK